MATLIDKLLYVPVVIDKVAVTDDVVIWQAETVMPDVY